MKSRDECLEQSPCIWLSGHPVNVSICRKAAFTTQRLAYSLVGLQIQAD